MKRLLMACMLLVAMLCLVGAPGYAAELLLPANIETIGAEAFCGDAAIGANIVLPEGLQRIESRAFANTGISRIYLPRSLTYIAPDAFQGCSLTAWGDYYSYARTYCSNNNIPFDTGTMTSASNFTFEFTSATEATITSYNGSANAIVIPRMADSTHVITRIGDNAFGDNEYNDHGHYPRCTQYTSVSIPDTVTEIGERAFIACTSLKAISFPNSVRKINNYAFSGCTGLTSSLLPMRGAALSRVVGDAPRFRLLCTVSPL